MCQVDQDYSGLMPPAVSPRISKVCVKCNTHPAAVLIRVGDAYCKGCFREYFIHKFRAVLGKNRIIFPGEKVLLAVSGGPSSCSMLFQVQEGLSENAHKKLRFTPGIVFIDEGALTGCSQEDRKKTVNELKAMFESTGFPFHIIPLEQVLELPPSVLMRPPSPSKVRGSSYKLAAGEFMHKAESSAVQPPSQKQEPADVSEAQTVQLQRLIASANTHTAQQELFWMLRQHLLLHTARKEGYSKLMLGESCTRLAMRLLSNISLGRGAQAAQDTGFSDSRYSDIIAVRPMRDYSAKEIAYYNHLFKVPCVFIPGLDFKMSNKASIQTLTENFVTKLQTEFPSTVSTIYRAPSIFFRGLLPSSEILYKTVLYRTSEKLQTSSKSPCAEDHSPRCVLCLCALDTAADSSSAFQATLISERLSQNKPSEKSCLPTAKTHSAGSCSGQCDGSSCSSTSSRLDLLELKTVLCYSCQLTIKDMSSLEYLPTYIVSEAERRVRRSQMRAEISEFLLD